MDTLRDKVAVITGAASGIGRAIARALAGRGAHIVAVDRDDEGIGALADELGRANVLAQRCRCLGSASVRRHSGRDTAAVRPGRHRRQQRRRADERPAPRHSGHRVATHSRHQPDVGGAQQRRLPAAAARTGQRASGQHRLVRRAFHLFLRPAAVCGQQGRDRPDQRRAWQSICGPRTLASPCCARDRC